MPCIPNPKKYKRNEKSEETNELTENTSSYKLKLEPVVNIEKMKHEKTGDTEKSDTLQEKIASKLESLKQAQINKENTVEDPKCVSQTSTESLEENLDNKNEETDKSSECSFEHKRGRGRPRKTSETVTETKRRSRSSMRIRALEEKNGNGDKPKEDLTATETKAAEINHTENVKSDKKINNAANRKVEEQNKLNSTTSLENTQNPRESRPRGRPRKRIPTFGAIKTENVKKPDIIELALANLENEEPLQTEKNEKQIINETESKNARQDIVIIQTEKKEIVSPPKQLQNNENMEESQAAKLIKLRYKPTTGVHNVHSTITEKLQEAHTVFNTENQPRICRTCLSDKNVTKHILEYIEDEITIMSTLMLCAFPLEVSYSIVQCTTMF